MVNKWVHWNDGKYRIIGKKRDEWLLCNGAGSTFYINKGECSEVTDLSPPKVNDIPSKSPRYNKRKEKHYELWSNTEALDVMKATLSHEEFIGFLKGNILKYQLRLGSKPGESIEKDQEKIKTYKQLLKEADE